MTTQVVLQTGGDQNPLQNIQDILDRDVTTPLPKDKQSQQRRLQEIMQQNSQLEERLERQNQKNLHLQGQVEDLEKMLFEVEQKMAKVTRWCIQADLLTDLSLIYLVDHFKEIESLVLLSAQNISDAALPHLGKLPKLVRFEMYGAALISESAKDLLQKQLPNLKCFITHQPFSKL